VSAAETLAASLIDSARQKQLPPTLRAVATIRDAGSVSQEPSLNKVSFSENTHDRCHQAHPV